MAITRQAAKRKAYAMLKDDEKKIKQNIVKLLNSGAINLDEWEDDYRLPHLLLSAALEDMAKQHQPPRPTTKDKSTLKNLKIYI